VVYADLVSVTTTRFVRLAGLAGLIFYSLLLLASSIPVALLPFKPLVVLKLASGLLLHLVGVTPGLEVFSGHAASHAIPHMSCFRITGQGARSIVLYDDLERCRQRRVEPIRDPFQVFQMRSLSGALVDINLGYRRSLAQEPMQSLFLFTDYYCHTAAAERANVRAVNVESLYVGLNLDDGTMGEVTMAGRRICERPTWEIR
jgi:hypothetical protein